MMNTSRLADSEMFLEILTLGLIEKLKKIHEITMLHFDKRTPCNRSTIAAWEQSNDIILPSNLKEFYTAIDGFYLTWKYLDENEKGEGQITIIGEIKINSIANLGKLHLVHHKKLYRSQLFHYDLAKKKNISDQYRDYDISTAFVLSQHINIGSVCLVYYNDTTNSNTHSTFAASKIQFKSSIVLLDESNCWHFLAKDFSTYFRMLLLHAGLDGWLLKFTSSGLTTSLRKTIAIASPYLLQENELNNDESDIPKNIIDDNIFKTSNPNKKSGNGNNARGKGNHRKRNIRN